MKKIRFAMVTLLCGLLMFAASCGTSSSDSSSSISTLEETVRAAWLKQGGNGMFFGTGADRTSDNSQVIVQCSASWGNDPGSAGVGILNVTGLASQFPDGTTLWLKFTCPGANFGSAYILFRIMKCQTSSTGGIISEQFDTEFSAAVDPTAFIVRLQMPSFSIGPGTYQVSAYTNGTLRLIRYVVYLAPGEQPDANFRGGY
jgi:hypothetical protein